MFNPQSEIVLIIGCMAAITRELGDTRYASAAVGIRFLLGPKSQTPMSILDEGCLTHCRLSLTTIVYRVLPGTEEYLMTAFYPGWPAQSPH